MTNIFSNNNDFHIGTYVTWDILTKSNKIFKEKGMIIDISYDFLPYIGLKYTILSENGETLTLFNDKRISIDLEAEREAKLKNLLD